MTGYNFSNTVPTDRSPTRGQVVTNRDSQMEKVHEMGSTPKKGSFPQASMPQTPGEGAYPSLFTDILIKAIYLIALVAQYFALAKTYTEFLQPLYKYEHYKQHFVPMREVESLVVLCVAAAVMPANFRRPSDLYVSLAIVVMLVPTAMMYTYGELRSETAYVTFAGLAVIIFAREIPINLPVWRVNGVFLLKLFTCLTLLGVVTAVYQIGFDSFSLDLLDVYGRRAVAFEALTGISAYIVFLALNINLVAIILSFLFRSWVLLVINWTASFVFFGLEGNKGVFFGAFIWLSFSFIVQSRFCIVYTVVCFSTVTVGYYLFFMGSEHETFASLFQLRSLILPVHLNNEYLKYFSDLKLYLAYSKVSLGLVDNPLSLVEGNPATTVAYHWVGRTTMHANTGFVGSGYMNAGLIGILIYAVVIGLCCRVIDFYAQFRGAKIFATLICLDGFLTAVHSSDLPTTLFGAGWSLAILLVAVLELPESRTTLR